MSKEYKLPPRKTIGVINKVGIIDICSKSELINPIKKPNNAKVTATKISKKSSKKSSKKASKKSSKKASKKTSKKKKGSKKAKREAPAHAAIQTEVIKMIVAKDGINYPAAMKKLKEYMTKALGKPYEKGGDITYMDALKKTKDMLSK